MTSNFSSEIATDINSPSKFLLMDGDGQRHAVVIFGIYEAKEMVFEVIAH